MNAFLKGLTSSPQTLPSTEARQDIIAKLTELVTALEAHPSWTPPQPHPGLFHVWDFVSRSRYIMTELDNIEAGRPVQHPEQIPPNNNGEHFFSWNFLGLNPTCLFQALHPAPTSVFLFEPTSIFHLDSLELFHNPVILSLSH